ncbi:uncharacterized protein MELLADRAFT_86875 [Melampsora larici-populina 98AG31]|uniref:Uncharacterized protein n=1 Tax=Melampsora larici-populina (strain 98AG31 / pathotype 3-4-7) TaxID=747676 RepID=F4R3P8_MELLP|nr:uncharacterized protein MELLADRAFT_86875 [Melampsora larici-populina 98AG31]EGG12666.1 hypothetical protein MELLADRAFT_86875 [Melampsora larici-populina 98AG31]
MKIFQTLTISEPDEELPEPLSHSFSQINGSPDLPANPIPTLQAQRNVKRDAKKKAKAQAAELTISDRARARRLNGVLKKAPHPRDCPSATNTASGGPGSFISDPILNHQRGIFKKITFSQDDWKLVKALNVELKLHLVQIPPSSKLQLIYSQLILIKENNCYSLKQLNKHQQSIYPDTARILMMRCLI